MTDKPDEPQIEVLVGPVWPTLKALGFRTRPAAYAAVKRGAIPKEGLVKIGELTRISLPWIRRVTGGKKSR
jgi:hypothetical protein